MKSMRVMVAAICLVGCVNSPEAGTRESAPSANTVSGMQVGLGSCVSLDSDANRSLLPVVFAAAVSEGLNLLNAALSQAASDTTWSVRGARNLPARADGKFPSCVQIVRGRFRTDFRQASGDPLNGLSLPDGARGRLEANGIWLADRPDFVFEGQILTSADETAATIRPLYATMVRPIEDRGLGEQGMARSVVAFFALSRPGQSPALDGNPAATVVLGPMRPGQVLRFAGFASDGSGQPSAVYDTPWFTLSAADAKGPLTATAMISETRPGNEFAKFLAAIFTRPDVASEITQAITQ